MSHKPEIRLEVKEEKNYSERSISRFVLLLGIYILLALVAGECGNGGKPLGMGLSFFVMFIALALWFLIKDDPLNTRFFLTSFEMSGDNVTISYKDKMALKKITGRKSDFSAEVVSGWIGTGGSFTQYLLIKYKDKMILKQAYSSNKDEKVKNEIVSYLKQDNTSQDT